MKDIKKILLLMLCFLINIDFCYAAYNFNTSFKKVGQGGTESAVPGDTDNDGKINGGYTRDGYTCSYDYIVNYGNGITVDVFNQNNDSILNNKAIPDELTKIGTSVGISINESKTAGWEYVFEVKKIKVSSYEKYTYTYSCYNGQESKTIIFYKMDDPNYLKYEYDGDCVRIGAKTEVISYSSDEDVLEGEEYNDCKNTVVSKVENIVSGYLGGGSYDIYPSNPNDVDAGIVKNKLSTFNEGYSCNFGEPTGSCSSKIGYTIDSVCINRLTSDVTYRGVGGCLSDELKVENDSVNGGKHFHYFIPLNVVNDSFSLIISGENDFYSKKDCETMIMDNSENYFYSMVGVRASGETFVLSDNITAALGSVENGCYIRTEIRIPVSNGLYNVTDNKIKGYNLYVKNVDENNPFPNPVTNLDSMWFDWYHSNYSSDDNYDKINGESPKIKDSFKKENLSYSLMNVNAKKIRSLNSSLNDYLTVNLKSNGTSEFIRDGEVFFNKVANTNTFYNLGCGPLNSSLYEKECK